MLQWQPGMTIDAVEKECILQAFRFYRGNKTQTSIALGVSIRTLDNKLERYESESTKQAQADERERERNEETLQRMRGPFGTPHRAGGTF